VSSLLLHPAILVTYAHGQDLLVYRICRVSATTKPAGHLFVYVYMVIVINILGRQQQRQEFVLAFEAVLHNESVMKRMVIVVC
jgi:hypothetical protein